MSQEWMINVLTDLKKFASMNGLCALAQQLDDTILFAATELEIVNRQNHATRVKRLAKKDRCLTGPLIAGKNI